MQATKQDAAIEYEAYTLNHNTIIMFDTFIKHEKYSCEWYCGIIFYIPNDGNIITGNYGIYDVVNNKYMGNRILVSNKDGWKDIPFKKTTFHFLPPGVRAIEL